METQNSANLCSAEHPEQKTVAILLSSKRSGSTLFQREICKHPEIRTVDYSPHTYLETHHWLKGAVILNPDKKLYDGYGSVANARTYTIDCLSGNLPNFQIPTDDRELIFKGWDALCAQFAQPVFFEKSPQFIAHWSCLELLAEWIRSTKYKVKVIGLTRNPLSVQYSALELFHTDPEKRQYAWKRNQENLLKFQELLSPDQYHHIKYEEMIEQSVETFAEVCKFIGVKVDSKVGQDVHSKSLTKWKDDPYFRLRLDTSVIEVAKQFGYSQEQLDNPEKPEPPLSWKLQKKIEGTYKLTCSHLKNRIFKPLMLRLRLRSSNSDKRA
ncbi:MAG: sulfotransferase family protein [Opitutaceae bacterium]